MRMLFIAVFYFGLPLHAAVTNPFVTDISENSHPSLRN